MKSVKTVITLLYIFFSIHFGIAQEDSTVVKIDSVALEMRGILTQKIYEIESRRVADSIKRTELEEEIKSLKTTDNLKKEELQAELEALNQKEKKRISDKKKEIEALKNSNVGYPVKGFFKDTLFSIYTKLGSFSAKERAEAIERRLKSLGDDINFNENSIKIDNYEIIADIVYGEMIVMSVSEIDALWNDSSVEKLSEKYSGIITQEILRYRNETSFTTLAKEIGIALLVILIIILLIIFIIRFFRWVDKKIIAQEGKRIKALELKDYTLFDAKRQIRILLLINKILKWFVIFIAIYIMLPILFGIFPWTKHFAGKLFGYVLNPLKKILHSFWNYLPDLITIVVIIVVFRYILKGIRFFKDEIAKGNLKIDGFYPDWAAPTFQIVRVLIIAFMLVVIFPYLPGSDSPIFKGVSVFLGFLFTFGSAGSLSNVIAGMVLTYMRLFTLGDRVKIGDVVGDVIEKSTLVTRVRTNKNEIISIPNSTVMSSHTINYSSDAPEKGLIIHTTVTIGYDVPWKDMYAALIDAALRTDYILKEPQPFVLQTSLEDFYVAYQINAYVREANKQATIYSDLHQNIQDSCNEKGIEILSPHYRAARDGNKTSIPSDYLPKDYEAPSFNIKTQTRDKKD